MTIVEHFRAAVKARKEGKACPYPHGEWRPTDELAIRYFIPEDLRNLYWLTNQQRYKEAYVESGALRDRIRHLPYLWRFPESINVGGGTIISMEEMIKMAFNARAKYLESIGRSA